MARAGLAAAVWLAWIAAPGSAAAASNAGGVLLLHLEANLSPDAGAGNVCGSGTLTDWRDAVVRVPGDGRGHLVLLYAAFPPDSAPDVKALCFGLRYTSNVKILAQGPCNGDGILVPHRDWPASESGAAITFRPGATSPLFPVHWFSLSARGVGYFETTPHPNPGLRGDFADSETPAALAPISGYGSIGFDVSGSVPEPGHTPDRGACCLGERTCIALTIEECTYYLGTYLGPEIDCAESGACDPGADRGACCLPSGCQMQTRRDCVANAGGFLGEKAPCVPDPCGGQRARP